MMDEHLQQEFRHKADEASHQRRISGRTGVLWVVILLLIAAAVAITGVVMRADSAKKLAINTNASAAPPVLVSRPQQGAAVQEVVLPGNVYAYTDSPIYARTNGYLRKWYFDIGAHVRQGDLLATISAPELDQQVLQAQADLETARTNAGNAAQTAKRYQDLLPSAAVSRQETETAVAQATSGGSSVLAAQANLQRLQSLQKYEKVYAPFTGVVTARNVDIGQLISSGSSGGSASQLFHMAAVRTLRIYVSVPQSYGDVAKPGTKAFLSFDEYPGKTFPVTVARTSRYIDPASRTLLVELDYNNLRSGLTPGSFTQVHFHLDSPKQSMFVPASALLFRSEGLRIATVSESNGKAIAHLQPVAVGQDDGKVIQIVSGLNAGEAVIQNPPDSLVDGEEVEVMKQQQQPTSAGGRS